MKPPPSRSSSTAGSSSSESGLWVGRRGSTPAGGCRPEGQVNSTLTCSDYFRVRVATSQLCNTDRLCLAVEPRRACADDRLARRNLKLHGVRADVDGPALVGVEGGGIWTAGCRKARERATATEGCTCSAKARGEADQLEKRGLAALGHITTEQPGPATDPVRTVPSAGGLWACFRPQRKLRKENSHSIFKILCESDWVLAIDVLRERLSLEVDPST